MLYYRKIYGKIVHTKNCHFIKNVNFSEVDTIDTMEEAYAKGYCFCENCNPLNPFVSEFAKVSKDPKYRRFDLQDHETFIRIFSAYGEWRLAIMPDGERVQLYHKDRFETPKDAKRYIRGFHCQKAYCYTLSAYLDYIMEHDWYRTLHPAHNAHKTKKPAKQWTPRYKKEQKKAKNRERRQSVRNVLSLIDSLQLQPAVS